MKRAVTHTGLLAGLVALCLAPGSLAAADSLARTVRAEPRESDEPLANPGMGWQTFHRFASKVILIGSEEGMAQAVAKRYGWRADCLGDLGGFSKAWNHMDHFYLQQLAKTGAEDAWKQGPVAWESCWDMRK